MCFRERETKHDYFEEAIWVVNVYFFEMNFFFFFYVYVDMSFYGGASSRTPQLKEVIIYTKNVFLMFHKWYSAVLILVHGDSI